MQSVRQIIRRHLLKFADYLRARVKRSHQQYFIKTGEFKDNEFWEWAMLALARDIYNILGVDWPDDENGGNPVNVLQNIGG